MSADVDLDGINRAKKAMDFSYSPYSKFKVGAALFTASGRVFTGTNIENISYGLTMCAERVALFKAISEGHSLFSHLTLSSSGTSPIYPCGACRQVLAEFNPDLKIHIDGVSKIYVLSDLLPSRFSEE